MEWQISDVDIEVTEKLLLPQGRHFPEDARNVIRCWHSTDVAACPGSGKTTVILAKLKLLADRMPLENGAGVCVLSHTNVAVDEIKKRLSDYADKLLGYPNYMGTIQSFVDRFITMPYLRNISGQTVQVVDDFTYVQHMLIKIQKDKKFKALNNLIEYRFKLGKQFKTIIDYIQALNIQDGALYVGKQKNALAGKETASAKQYNDLIMDLLKNEGIIRYQDSYSYARAAIGSLTDVYTNLFSSRFQYVFIDEYQDCNEIQRQAIDLIFDSSKCAVFKIGDSDQAIYNSSKDTTPDWVPQTNFLPILTSCRFSQEIADVICHLKKESQKIVTLSGKAGVKPILFVFSPEKIDRVVSAFINAMENHDLCDSNGVYKVIGAVKKEDSSGLKIGSYWPEFDASLKKNSEYSYWALVDEIILSLSEGKLYRVELIIRRILCRILHYIGENNPVSGKDYTVASIKKTLNEKYGTFYHQWIYEMSKIQNINRESVDKILRVKINELLKTKKSNVIDVFAKLPDYFLKEYTTADCNDLSERNVLIDPIRGRRIVFDTVHGVKGETHDATLYLETYRSGASDLRRILPYFGVGKKGTTSLHDVSRKLAYVGMSRPRKLLCVAMQSKTYEESKGVFDNDWEIIDLRD